jgi:hypothetical protein
MPGKSRHGKGKRYKINKKRIAPRQNPVTTPATTTPVPPLSATPAPAPAAPPRKATATPAVVMANLNAYVPGDLRYIGILTGIIIVILFILYFILP